MNTVDINIGKNEKKLATSHIAAIRNHSYFIRTKFPEINKNKEEMKVYITDLCRKIKAMLIVSDIKILVTTKSADFSAILVENLKEYQISYKIKEIK